MTRRSTPYAALGVLLALVLTPLLLATPASAGRTLTISITATGPKPSSAVAAVGDTVRFVNEDATFVHQVRSKSPNWTFDSAPLAPGQSFTAPALAKAGEYVYQGANLDTFTGKVVVPAGTTVTPTPTRSATPAPSRSAAPGPSPSAPTPSPSPSPAVSGGSGSAPAPFAGGFGSVGIPGGPGGSSGALAPNVAPTLGGAGTAPSAGPSGEVVAVGSGRLPEPPTGRRYGLPAVLAATAALGVGSLLVRLLLAHPAARRPRHAAGRRDPTATVD